MTSAFAKNNNLQSISYVKFGTDSGTELGSVSQSDWTTKITNNSQLWDSITTVMNSLAYNQSLNNSTNESGKPANNGIWPETPNTPNWYQTNLTKDDLVGNNKWHNNDSATATTSQTLGFALNDSEATKSVSLKHNNIVWVWTQTKTGSGSDATISITLKTHESTIPNIYKGVKNVIGDTVNSSSPDQPKDTAYTFKTWTKVDGTNLTGDQCGVSFTFKITG